MQPADLAADLTEPGCAWMRDRLLEPVALKHADVAYFSAWLYGYAAALETERLADAERLRLVAKRMWGLL